MNTYYFVLANRSYILIVAESEPVAKRAFQFSNRGKQWVIITKEEPESGNCIEIIKQRETL